LNELVTQAGYVRKYVEKKKAAADNV
jgi:hypothetical protein